GDLFVNNLPTETYRMLRPDDRTPALDAIRYSALLSFICATRRTRLPGFYWLNLSPGETTASAIFQLSALNPSIGTPGETCLNFAGNYRTHPSIASTGTALGSGIEAGETILRAHGQGSDLAELARSFRLRSMPAERSGKPRRGA